MGAACHACIGGTNLRNEIQKLQAEAPHIVVGTPGRVFDMLTRGHLCKYHVQQKIIFAAIHFASESMTANATFLCRLKMDQDVCSG